MKKFFGNMYLIIIMLFLYLPILTLIFLSFNESRSMSVFTRFSLKWYQEMFHSRLILGAIVNTFSIAILASLIATVIGTLAVLGIESLRPGAQQTLLAVNNIPMLNADIVTGISLMLSFLLFGVSLGYMTILFSHVTFCIPYVILSVRPRLNKRTDTLLKPRWTWEPRVYMLLERSFFPSLCQEYSLVHCCRLRCPLMTSW